MSKFKELLEEAKKEEEGLTNRKVVFQDILAEQGDCLIQDLTDQAGQLHQTIVTLEADKKLLNQENSELKRQLQESKSHLQMLSQEMAARDKRLEEGMEVLKGRYEQKFNSLEEDEILKGLTKERRNRMAKKLLEELLTRARPIFLIVTCPDCKGNLSVRFRLRLKSKKRDAK